MKKKVGLVLVVAVFMVFAASMNFSNVDGAAVNYGWFTLVPPVVSILLAFVTKNVIISLFIGVFSGAYVLHLANGSLFFAVMQAFLSVVN